jgi:hypothetical protein
MFLELLTSVIQNSSVLTHNIPRMTVPEKDESKPT